MPAQIPWSQLKRILVVRTDHVGDLLCSTPFLRALRAGCPEAEITAWVAPASRDVLQGNPAVDHIVALDSADRAAWTGNQPPDLALALAPRSRAYQMVCSSRAPIRAGYIYPERPLIRILSHWWLTHRVPMPVRALQPDQVPHEVQQLASFARALGLPEAEGDLELPLSPEDIDWGCNRARGRIGVQLSSGWLTHGWQLSDFVEMCRALPTPPLVSYGPPEAALASQLKESGLELCGELTLKRWAALLGGCSVVVSPDTGSVHVAASQRRPVVVCYQPQHFALCSRQWHPWHVPQCNLSKGQPAATIAAVAQAVRELSPAAEEPRQGA